MRKTWLKRASVMCMAALLAATGVLCLRVFREKTG